MKIKLIDFGYKHKPNRAHFDDVGADVFTINRHIIPAQSSCKIPLGFGLELPNGLAAWIMPKSGLTLKGLTPEMAPIDPGYKGEINAIVTNNTNSDILVEPDFKIGQLVIVPVLFPDFEDGEYFNNQEQRGAGAFGSTGTTA